MSEFKQSDQDAQEAPGAIESEPGLDAHAEAQEAQDGDASPVAEGDTPGEPADSGSSDPGSTPDGSEAGPGDDGPPSDASGSAPDGDGSSGEPGAATPTPEPEDEPEGESPGNLMEELEEIRLHAADIAQANRKVKKARETLEERQDAVKKAKEREKEAEAALETAQKELEEAVDESERYPLIHAAKQNRAAKRSGKAAKKAEPKPDAPAQEAAIVGRTAVIPDGSDPWRAVRLDTLALPKAVLAKLADSNFHTVGDIHNLQSRGNMTLQDIKGIGEKAENQILDALDKFWEQNPQYTRDAAEEAPAEEPAQEHGSEPVPEEEAAIEEPALELDTFVLPGDVPEESIPDDVPPPDVEVDEAKPKKSKKKKG